MSNKKQYILDTATNTVTARTYSETISNLDEFVTALSADRDLTTPTLPQDCIQYQSTQNGSTYFIYKPAEILKFGVSGLVGSGSDNVLMDGLELAVPDRLYVFRGDRSINTRGCRFVFTTATDRETFKQSLCGQPWLPNMYSGNGSFCGGAEFENICAGSGSMSSRINVAVAYMEKSMFNNDLDYSINAIGTAARNRAEDCFGVEIDGINWSESLRSDVEAGSWHGSIKCFLRLHMATKRMLNEQGEAACIAAARADLSGQFSLEDALG